MTVTLKEAPEFMKKSETYHRLPETMKPHRLANVEEDCPLEDEDRSTCESWIQNPKGEWAQTDKPPPPSPGLSPQVWTLNAENEWIEVPLLQVPPPPRVCHHRLIRRSMQG
eukprot:2644237-Amphidinium_carterae.1